MYALEEVIVQGRISHHDNAAQGYLMFTPKRFWVGDSAVLAQRVKLDVLGKFHVKLSKGEKYTVFGPFGQFDFTLDGDGPFELADLRESGVNREHRP